MALLNFVLFCFVLYCYAFVQYCYLKSIQYNALHKFSEYWTTLNKKGTFGGYVRGGWTFFGSSNLAAFVTPRHRYS